MNPYPPSHCYQPTAQYSYPVNAGCESSDFGFGTQARPQHNQPQNSCEPPTYSPRRDVTSNLKPLGHSENLPFNHSQTTSNVQYYDHPSLHRTNEASSYVNDTIFANSTNLCHNFSKYSNTSVAIDSASGNTYLASSTYGNDTHSQFTTSRKIPAFSADGPRAAEPKNYNYNIVSSNYSPAINTASSTLDNVVTNPVPNHPPVQNTGNYQTGLGTGDYSVYSAYSEASYAPQSNVELAQGPGQANGTLMTVMTGAAQSEVGYATTSAAYVGNSNSSFLNGVAANSGTPSSFVSNFGNPQNYDPHNFGYDYSGHQPTHPQAPLTAHGVEANLSDLEQQWPGTYYGTQISDVSNAHYHSVNSLKPLGMLIQVNTPAHLLPQQTVNRNWTISGLSGSGASSHYSRGATGTSNVYPDSYKNDHIPSYGSASPSPSSTVCSPTAGPPNGIFAGAPNNDYALSPTESPFISTIALGGSVPLFPYNQELPFAIPQNFCLVFPNNIEMLIQTADCFEVMQQSGFFNGFTEMRLTPSALGIESTLDYANSGIAATILARFPGIPARLFLPLRPVYENGLYPCILCDFPLCAADPDTIHSHLQLFHPEIPQTPEFQYLHWCTKNGHYLHGGKEMPISGKDFAVHISKDHFMYDCGFCRFCGECSPGGWSRHFTSHLNECKKLMEIMEQMVEKGLVEEMGETRQIRRRNGWFKALWVEEVDDNCGEE